MLRKAKDLAGLAAAPSPWGQTAVGAQLWGKLRGKGHQPCLGESRQCLRGRDREQGGGGERGLHSIREGWGDWVLESSRAGFGPVDVGPGRAGTMTASPEGLKAPHTGSKPQAVS